MASTSRYHARQVVEQGRMIGLLAERLDVNPNRFVPVLLARVRHCREHRLPRGDDMCLAGLAAEREHDRVLFERDRPAPQLWIAEEHELTSAELVLVPVDREERPAAQDEVDLFVPELALCVLLDDLPAHLERGVGVDTERPDVEVPADRMPDESVRHLDRVELVDVRDAHFASSSKRGFPRNGSRSVSWGSHFSTLSRFSSRAERRCSSAASVSPAIAS